MQPFSTHWPITIAVGANLCEALRYYFRAARESKGYLSKNYWWAEAAGCFFRLKKYRYAEAFYRKSLTFPGQENAFNQILLADALFYQGYYQQAATQLDEYATNSRPTAYAVILHYLSSTLAARFGDKNRDALGAEQAYFTQEAQESTVEILRRNGLRKRCTSTLSSTPRTSHWASRLRNAAKTKTPLGTSCLRLF